MQQLPYRGVDHKDAKNKDWLAEYEYQSGLTERLDKLAGDFTQDTINEIALWKVNRYPHVEPDVLDILNKISADASQIDGSLTRKVLSALLDSRGIRLPMASTILRFRNPHIYQIIDQRVYRFIYDGELLKEPINADSKVDYYLAYLDRLREKSAHFKIRFEDADRIFYQADKVLNKSYTLKA